MVYVNIDLGDYIGDFQDGELIEELKARGYNVDEEPNMSAIQWHWDRGEKKEALILLEREYKFLRGISNLV